MNFSDPTAIMFGIYLLAMLFIGFLGYRGTDNLDDYILGGRSLVHTPVKHVVLEPSLPEPNSAAL